MGAIVQSDIFMELDRKDQQQIVAAMTGDVIGELMYQVKGKDAISWAGINHICFFMGDIGVDEWVQWERIEMFGDRVYWCATVRAQNTKYGLSSLGTAECPELKKIYDLDDNKERIPVPGKPGESQFHLEPDEHCRRKALSKAQRNAKRAVIPEALLKKWLGYFRDKKNNLDVSPPGQPKYVDADYKVKDPPKKRAPPKKVTKKKAKVGPPPRREPPKKADPKPEEKPPTRTPESVDDVTERIAHFLPGHGELVVSSDRDDYYRVGRKQLLDKEIEQHLDFLISEMGGEWINDANEWRIPKKG